MWQWSKTIKRIDGKITGKVWFVRGALERFYVFGKEFSCPWDPAVKAEKNFTAFTLLRSAFFTDVSAEVKKFSLLTQEKNVNVTQLLNAVKSTKPNYE